QRNPGDREGAGGDADVEHRLEDQHGREPYSQHRAVEVRSQEGDPVSSPGDDEEQSDDGHRAHETQLLPEDGKDEVRMLLGKGGELLPPRAEAQPEETA